jgi:hypothetical protein
MGILLDWATFVTLFILVIQYAWEKFISVWYEDRLEKKGLRKDEAANEVAKKTRKLARIVMFLLILAVILALVDLIWK